MIDVTIKDAAPLLSSALRRSAAAAGVVLDIAAMDESPWASLTFTGTRHRLTCTAEASDAAAAWLAAIATVALPMRGHVAGEPHLVDCATDHGRLTATLELVTIEDG